MQVLLVGNKTDLESERQVSTEEGRLFAKKEGLNFIEISAKDYKKVEGAFNVLAENILKLLESGEVSEQTVGIKVADDLKIDPLSSSQEQSGRFKRCC
jgi:GTPase SAR1 family protein